MRYTFEEEFRLDHPETVGETDIQFDLENYKDWLEAQLIEARKQAALYKVVGQSKQLVVCKKCGSSEMYQYTKTKDKCEECGNIQDY